MSLTDLKKSHQSPKPKKKKVFTVDDFIADAENYAKGHRDILSDGTLAKPLALAEALAVTQKTLELEQQHKPFKHATFTLSEEAIAQLTELAKTTQLSKSHILRILIDEMCQQDQREQLKKLLNSSVK
jgi:hypothetical protein